MINYFKWQKRQIMVTSLRLDSDNPRLTEYGKKPTQPDIIDYLITHEKVYELAKTIISQGYFLNEQPIVTKEDNKFVVLEGNRRVCACKILINPDLIKSSSKRSQLKKELKGFDLEMIKKLDVIIAPDRESADIMIVNRHTGGSVVEKWDKTKQDRFIFKRFIAGESIEQMAQKFHLMKAEIKDSLQRHNVFSEILKLDFDEHTKKILDEETKFNITNVERVYSSKIGRDFLGIEFNDVGQIVKKLPVQEFNKRLKTIVDKVISGEINSRVLNTEEQKRDFINRLLETKEFDSSIEPDSKYNQEEQENEQKEGGVEKPAIVNKKKPTPSTKLFPGNLYLETNVKRIDEIFSEIKSLNLKNNPNAIAVLLRSYIDMVTYQYLKKNGGIAEIIKIEGEKLKGENEKYLMLVTNFVLGLGIPEDSIDKSALLKALKLKGSLGRDFIPSLRFMLSYLADSDLIQEAKLKAALKSYLNKNNSIDKVIGHNEFNLLVHNEYYTNDAVELKAAWDKLEPILEYMIKEIKK